MAAPLFLSYAYGSCLLAVAILFVVLDRFLNHGLGSQIGSFIYSTGGIIINRINFGVYKNLDLASSSSEIRLVHILPGSYGRIRCKLVHGNWRTSSYEALSYSWGNAVLVTQIELNGRVFLIGRNLHTALESLRLGHRERAVWIDALSINQMDNIERDHQVQQMRQIYENATTVVVSLGDGTPSTTLGFEYLNNNPNGGPSYVDVRDAKGKVQSLLSHPWWKRVWVIQEIAVAKKIQICRGSYSVPWDVFCRFVTREQPQPQGDQVFARALYKFVEKSLPTLRSHPVLEYGLLDLAHEFRSREATNPRDKLYALLGLMPLAEERGLVPDYSKPVREVYMDFVRSHIAQYQTLAILGFAEYRNSRNLQLPSWCPDWTVQEPIPPPFWQKSLSDLSLWLHKTQNYYNAAGTSISSLVHHPDPEVLGLRGFLFDKILKICDPFVSKKKYKWQVMHRKDAFHNTITANAFRDKPVDWDFIEHGYGRNQIFPEREEMRKQVSKAVDLACLNRRFFVTRRGFMGLAPVGARKGDLVCVLLGGNIPFILRQAGSYYRMIGQSYVHGIMAYSDGEMEEDVRTKKVEYQDFFIK